MEKAEIATTEAEKIEKTEEVKTQEKDYNQPEEEKKGEPDQIQEAGADDDAKRRSDEMVEKAYSFKDEGNMYFKQKDYKKAISKYARVELYVKPLAALDEDNSGADPTMAMVSGMS